MKTFIALLFLTTFSLYADVKYDMYQFYQQKQYKKACVLGSKHLNSYRRDEEYVSLYAFSCLYIDSIDLLSAPATLLKQTESSRTNSAYFAIIIMQKKLLYHALLDHYDLSTFVLPSTDYILSKVFDAYAKLGKHKPKDFYIFQDPKNDKKSYKLYVIQDHNRKKMIIEELYDTMLVKRHEYW
jgi:hypothetical protein